MTPKNFKSTLHPYLEIIENFLNGGIPDEEISRVYQKLFLENPAVFGSETPAFRVVNEFFLDCEDYVEDPRLRQSGDFDADELRRRAQRARTNLVALMAEDNGRAG